MRCGKMEVDVRKLRSEGPGTKRPYVEMLYKTCKDTAVENIRIEYVIEDCLILALLIYVLRAIAQDTCFPDKNTLLETHAHNSLTPLKRSACS